MALLFTCSSSPDFVGAQCPNGAHQLVYLRSEIEFRSLHIPKTGYADQR